jgi:hypothetical protein
MKVRRWKRTRLTTIMVRVSILAALMGETRAQSPAVPVSPLGRERQGWRMYNVATSFGYSSLALQNSINTFSLQRLEGDYDATASVSFGYNYRGLKGGISLLYVPSYVGRVKYSQLSSFNQFLNFRGFRQLTRRWDLSVAIAGTDSTLDQLLFTPAILSAATTPLATLDDFIQTAHSGQYTSDQLASIITGAPYVATPARSILYGSRYLSSSVSSGVTYRHSPRLRFNLSAEVIRSQTRNDAQDFRNQVNFLIPRTTSAQVGASFDYSLSPRTEIGVKSNSAEIDSSFARYIVADTSLFLSRKLSPNWFIRIAGGPGFIRVLRTDPRFGRQAGQALKLGYTVQGNVGYTVRGQSVTGSYDKRIGDTYGFGSQASEMLGGGWQWNRPGHSWALYASAGVQRMFNGMLGDVQNWYGNTGFAHSLSRHLSLNFTYGYVFRRTGTSNMTGVLQQNLDGSSARITLLWNPQGHREEQMAETGRNNTGTLGR